MMILSWFTITGIFGQQDSLKQENYSDVSLPFGETTKREVTTPVTVITGDELEKFPSTNLAEALVGKIPSAQFLTTENGPGQTSVNISIRGFGYLVLVDGAARNIGSLSTSEVESVTILHGMAARAIYGYRARNGVLIIKTKRGIVGEDGFTANVEYGVRSANEKRMPNWLNSYDYARLYNEASLNDGLEEPYSNADMEGYKNENSLRYPDVDLYNEMFNSAMQFSRANIEYNGGNERNQFYLNMNYVGEGKGYLKNKDISHDNLRVRANIDARVNDFIKMRFDAIGELYLNSMPNSANTIWEAIAYYPSNAYPLTIAPDTFGRSANYPLNPYASVIKEEKTNTIGRTGQFNGGLDFDLDRLIPGLRTSLYGTYDIYSYQSFVEKKNYQFPLYEPIWFTNINDNDSLALQKYGSEIPDAGTSLESNNYMQTFAANAKIAYSKSFQKHVINTRLISSIQDYLVKGVVERIRYQDFGLAFNYGYAQKYYADIVLSYTGCMHLEKNSRFGFFPSFGLGWIISEENFMKEVSAIDFLKLRGSYGTMGSYDSDAYIPHRTEWNQNGARGFGISGNTSYEPIILLSQVGNENIDWGKQTEVDMGIEAIMLNKSLSMQLDYYSILRSGIIMNSLLPDIAGNYNYYDNIGEYRYYGFDGHINYSNRVASVNYSLGLNFGYNNSEVIKDNQIQYDEDWRNTVGNPVDAAYGYEALGLFGDQSDVDNSPSQSELGNALPGNIKYEDLNEDGSITAADEKMIGHWLARFKYGVNLNLKYKGIELYVLGYGLANRDINIRTNPYYYGYSTNKYSDYVLENRWVEGDRNAAHPRLTAGTSTNDNRNSSYWLIDGGFFKIKNVELAYNFSKEFNEKLKMKNLRIFVRGTNLATFSKIKDLDPEALSAGVYTYPTFRTFTGGITVKF